MTAPPPRAALTSDDIPPGPYSEDDLRQQWNTQADKGEQWDLLDSSEQLTWAQARAIAADRRASAALNAEPAREGPSERIISIAKAVQEHAFGWEPDARLIGNVCVEDVADLCSAVLARWGRPAAPPAPEDLATDQMMAANLSALLIRECGLYSPGSSAHDLLQRAAAMLVNYGLPARPAALPAPEVGDVGLLVDMLNQEAIALDSLCNKIVNGECRTVACLHRGGWIRGAEPADPSVATCPELEKAAAMRLAATLLQQQQHLLGLACQELDNFMEQQQTAHAIPLSQAGEVEA